VQIKKMNWHEYPILRLVVPLILGILFYLQFPQWAPPLISNLILLIVLGLLAWPKKYLFPYKHRYLSGLIVYFSFFIMGIGLSQFQHSYHKEDYFANQLFNSDYAIVTLIEPPAEKAKSVKLIVEVQQMGSKNKSYSTDGLAVLYLQKDSTALNLQYGNVLIIPNSLKLVSAPQNPDEFDYQTYLSNSGIEYQAYLRKGTWQKTKENRGNPIKAYAIGIRQFLLQELQRHGIRDAEFSVTAAMLLGVRSHLSPELQQSFSGAGAMHILCVSGLHVGIIFMLLNYFLGFFDYINRGPLFRSIIIIACIWAYAMITGLSPSVVRAATMFSFISIGQNISRHVNTYNSLAASAFVLLVFNPYLIIDLGFQLSYSAVIAIIALQKPLQDLWTPRWKPVFKIWQLTTVSIAAQIGTAPLAMYYFHSFPNYFLLTNLIVIPAAFGIFITGITVLVFSWAGVLADYFAWILSKMVAILNWIIVSIEDLPFAVSRDIYIDWQQLVILILLSVFISTMLIHRNKKLIFVNLILIVFLLIANINQKNLPDEFIVYQGGKYDYIAFMHHKKEIAITDADVLDYPEIMDYQTKEHRIRFRIEEREMEDILKLNSVQEDVFFQQQQFINFHNQRILIVNPAFAEAKFKKQIRVDYLIISGNPNIEITKLLHTVDCKQIIIASSNAAWNIKKWRKNLETLKTPTYFVKEEGAFVLGLE
jgi:competence protein ComEC